MSLGHVFIFTLFESFVCYPKVVAFIEIASEFFNGNVLFYNLTFYLFGRLTY